MDQLLVLQPRPLFLLLERLFVAFWVGVPLRLVPAGVGPELDVLVAARVLALLLFALALRGDLGCFLALTAGLDWLFLFGR